MVYSRALFERSWREPSSSPKLSAHSQTSLASPKRGLIARLPVKGQVNRAESILANQDHFNDGQWNHAVVIVDVEAGSDIATICSCTAWHNRDTDKPRSIQEKYPNEYHGSRYQYLAVEHGSTTKPHNGLPILRMNNGNQFGVQTYIDVGQYFQIETKYLLSWDTSSLVLTDNSLGLLVAHLIDWSEGRMPAYSKPDFITARSIGYKPVLSAECRSLAWRVSSAKAPPSPPLTPPTMPTTTTATSPERRAVGVYVPPHKRKVAQISSGTNPSPPTRAKKAPRKSSEVRVAS